jgi:hypothetical protein
MNEKDIEKASPELEVEVGTDVVDEVKAKAKAKAKPAQKSAPKKKEVKKPQSGKPEPLSMEALQKENKVLDLQGTAPIEVNGKIYEISYDKVFRKTKQRDVLQDMITFFKQMGEVDETDAEFATAYTTLLLVKHFTSLEVPDTVDESLKMLEVLIDLDVFHQILLVLPEDEVMKIYELMSDSIKTMTERYNEMQKEMDQAKTQIENKELQEYIEEMKPAEVTVEDIAKQDDEKTGGDLAKASDDEAETKE